jgi:hypothetical protein
MDCIVRSSRACIICAIIVCALTGCATQPALLAHDGHPTRAALDVSISLGRDYLVNSQLPAGNFVYEYDLVGGRLNSPDSPVRQAGALWGVALLHLESPSDKTRRAVVRGIQFFEHNSKTTPDGLRYVTYPGRHTGQTGVVSLTALALIEFLRAEPAFADRARYVRLLDSYLDFLHKSQLRPDGRMAACFQHRDGRGFGDPVGYYDGETLLAFVKAAKYLHRKELKPDIMRMAEAMYQSNIVRAREEEPDSDLTKSFYQWSSMAYHELFTSGWPRTKVYGKRTVELAHWMLDTHRVLARSRNTAYAFEGLASAYDCARILGDVQSMNKLRDAIRRGLGKLMTWQVGHPLANDFLRRHPTSDPLALGGVLNSAAHPLLRIDVGQHQTHAMILTRRLVYE